MTHLLDAHTLIWSQDTPRLLGVAAQDVLTDRDNLLCVGNGTLWEIGIKVATGKLRLSKPFRTWIDFAITNLDLKIVEITLDHIERVSDMPFLKDHRDPFDRILAAQSLATTIPVVSIDEIFDTYGVNRIWN